MARPHGPRWGTISTGPRHQSVRLAVFGAQWRDCASSILPQIPIWDMLFFSEGTGSPKIPWYLINQDAVCHCHWPRSFGIFRGTGTSQSHPPLCRGAFGPRLVKPKCLRYSICGGHISLLHRSTVQLKEMVGQLPIRAPSRTLGTSGPRHGAGAGGYRVTRAALVPENRLDHEHG